MAKSEKGPHRLRHVETLAIQMRPLGSFGKGDVIVRSGAPHMVVDARGPAPEPAGDEVWVCNLQTGSVWPLPSQEQVWPCTNVELKFESMRREF